MITEEIKTLQIKFEIMKEAMAVMESILEGKKEETNKIEQDKF